MLVQPYYPEFSRGTIKVNPCQEKTQVGKNNKDSTAEVKTYSKSLAATVKHFTVVIGTAV